MNQPVVLGGLADYNLAFGNVQTRQYDLGTPIALAEQQGASSFVGVRVTDGTDTAATYALFYANSEYPAILTAAYTGTLGNRIGLTLAAGSRTGTWCLTLQMIRTTRYNPYTVDVGVNTPQVPVHVGT